jgi:DnaJ-class molecular chaperone
MKKLQLSLKKEWFNLTKSGIKKEDYREINDYWCRRLLQTNIEIEHDIFQEMVEDLNNPYVRHYNVTECLSFYDIEIRKFDENIMTLGYPKSGDTERIIKLKNEGIEIRTGNSNWGATEGKLYFVIKHGAFLA